MTVGDVPFLSPFPVGLKIKVTEKERPLLSCFLMKIFIFSDYIDNILRLVL